MRLSLFLITLAAFGQSTKFEPPRQADGHPNLQGIWRNSAIVAAFNVEGQEAFYNEPGGKSVIVDATQPDIAIRMACPVCWSLLSRLNLSRTATTSSCFPRPNTACASSRSMGVRTRRTIAAGAEIRVVTGK